MATPTKAVTPFIANLPAGPAAPFVLRITEAWRKSLQGIIDAGRALIDAKLTLEYGHFNKMIREQLPFKYDTANALIKIANDRRLSNMELIPYLPPSWGALEMLSTLKDDVFYQAIKSGKIHAAMTQKEAKSLLGHAVSPTVRNQENGRGGESDGESTKNAGDAESDQSTESTDPSDSPKSSCTPTLFIEFTQGEWELIRRVMMEADRSGLVERVVKDIWPDDDACYQLTPPDPDALAEKLELNDILAGLAVALYAVEGEILPAKVN